jgi:hypothetical protein
VAVLALDRQRAVERLDAVAQAPQAATSRIGAPVAVVDDLDHGLPCGLSEVDPDVRGVRVLDGVRDRFGGHVVRGRLDGRRQTGGR